MYLNVLTLAVFLALSAKGFAQSIPNAFSTGNAKELSKNCAAILELEALDEELELNKSETEAFFRKFFVANKPTKFETVHSGKSQNGETYTIGKLHTNTGIYRITYYNKQQNNNNLITHMIIED